jgi:methionyl-tRNA formyltransferase
MLKIWGAAVADAAAQGLCGAGGEAGRIAGTDKDAVYVTCGEGVLALTEVQYEGKKRMSTRNFLLGARVEPGQKLTRER